MYLGVMGWIGAGLTMRGVQLLGQLKRIEAGFEEQKKVQGIKKSDSA